MLYCFHRNIQPLMTDSAFKGLFADRVYILNITASIGNDSTMKIENLTLTKRFYDDKENKAAYDYKAKFKLVSNKDKKELTDVAEGYIGLIKENGQWKVYAYKLYSLPPLLKKNYGNNVK